MKFELPEIPDSITTMGELRDFLMNTSGYKAFLIEAFLDDPYKPEMLNDLQPGPGRYAAHNRWIAIGTLSPDATKEEIERFDNFKWPFVGGMSSCK